MRLPSPALIVALVALFVSIGGVGYAASRIGTDDIKDRAVTTQKLDGQAVVARKIAPDAVKSAKLADHAVKTDNLAFQAVVTKKLEPKAVAGRKLADQAVTTEKLAGDSVTAGKLATTVRANSTEVADGSAEIVSTSCNPGEKVVGGGGVWSGNFDATEAQQTHIVQSSPAPDGDAWTALGFNNSGTTRTLTVRAICVNAD